jgi:hypothetical protein
MRFNQQIITTFALFSICAYANPIGNPLEVSNPALLITTREQVEGVWCGGMSGEEECKEHCQTVLGYNAKYKCTTKFVNF